MATTTPNYGLHVTPASDTTKKVLDWRNEVAGDQETSNMMIIDGALSSIDGALSDIDGALSNKANLNSSVLFERYDTFLPRVENWSALAYVHGKFVVLADQSDLIMYSDDGLWWNLATLPYSAQWKSITYGNGKFVIVSNEGSVICSTDIIRWESVATPSYISTLKSVTYGKGKFVAVSSNGYSIYSEDGLNWTMGTTPSAPWSSITYGNGKFVAVSSSGGLAAYSEDGVNWEQAQMPASISWSSVTCGGGRFVAVASQGAAYSDDGVAWEASADGNGGGYSVAYGNGKFVVPCISRSTYGYIAWYSEDGSAWSQSAETYGIYRFVAYGNGRFVAITSNSDACSYSDDGFYWLNYFNQYRDSRTAPLIGFPPCVHMHTASDVEADPAGSADKVRTDLTAEITTFEEAMSNKADLVEGKVPSSQLPSYVDDVLEYASLSDLPATGEAGKIYVITGANDSTNKTYRWSGTGYVEISPSIALGETSATAYRGDRGKVAYDHSQNGDVHVTAAQKTAWTGKPNLGETSSTAYRGDRGKIAYDHSQNSTIHVTADQKTEWSGKPDLGETSDTAYRGDYGKTAYDHSQTTGNPHETTISDIGAAAETHVHASADITSGTLPVARGGTSATSIAGASRTLGRGFGTCAVAAATAAKTVTCSGFQLIMGGIVTVVFTYGNTATDMTLNVQSRGAKAVLRSDGSAIQATDIPAGHRAVFVYDGTNWLLQNPVIDYALNTEVNEALSAHTGDTTIHVTSSDKTTWSGKPNLGETSATAYRGDRGKIAYDHSQATGNPHGATPADIGALPASGTATAATKLETARTIRTNLGSTSTASFNGTANITPGVTGTLAIANGGTGATSAVNAAMALGRAYGTCSTAAGTWLKVMTIDGFTRVLGSIIAVNFTNGNTVDTGIRLNVNGAGDTLTCRYNGEEIRATDIVAGVAAVFVFDGERWILQNPIGDSVLLNEHVDNTIVHTSVAEKAAWNGKPNLGETSGTAYRGDRGATAYSHSQVTGNPHGTTYSNIGAAPASHTHDDRYYTETEIDSMIGNINSVLDAVNGEVI